MKRCAWYVEDAYHALPGCAIAILAEAADEVAGSLCDFVEMEKFKNDASGMVVVDTGSIRSGKL